MPTVSLELDSEMSGDDVRAIDDRWFNFNRVHLRGSPKFGVGPLSRPQGQRHFRHR